MADFVFFSVIGVFKVLVDDGTDVGGDPDLGVITGLVTFTPSPAQAESQLLTPQATALLQPIRGRIEEDGTLRTLDSAPLYYKSGETRNFPAQGDVPVFVAESFPPGDPAYWKDSDNNHHANPAGTPVYGVRLAANANLGLSSLTYRVKFSQVVFDKRGDRHVDTFDFTAPTSDVEVDITGLAL